MSVTINNLGLDGGNPFDVYIGMPSKTNAREAVFKLIQKGETIDKHPVMTYIVELHDADGETVRYKTYKNWDISNSRFDSSMPKTSNNKVYTIFEWDKNAIGYNGEGCWQNQGSVYEDKKPNLIHKRIVEFVESNSNLAYVK